MREIYDFIFFIAAGISARFLYLAATALAKRTNLLPVTLVLDTLTALSVGGACIAYVILTSAVVAPYMFFSPICLQSAPRSPCPKNAEPRPPTNPTNQPRSHKTIFQNHLSNTYYLLYT